MDERPAAALSFPLPFSVFPLIPSLFSRSPSFSPLSCRGSSPVRGAPRPAAAWRRSCAGGCGPAPEAEARGRRRPTPAAEARGCGPVPAAEVRGRRCPAQAVETRAWEWPSPAAEARGWRCPAPAAEMRARGCGPAPAADVRRGQMQPASAAERPDPDGRSARAAWPGRGARLWAGRRRHADGGELRASAAGNGGGRPGAGSPQAAGEGLWPAPPLAHDFFSFSDQC